MAVLFATSPKYLEHLAGIGHPERPQRLEAVLAGARRAGVADALVALEPRAATVDELTRVHPAEHVASIENPSAVTHQEYVVVDRAGRLQIPEDYLHALGIEDRAVLRLEEGRVVIEPVRTVGTPQP